MSIDFIKKGRTGNNLFQYFISRILANKFNLDFKCNFFSPVLDFKPLKCYNNNYEQEIFINDTNIYRVFDNPEDFQNKNFCLDPFSEGGPRGRAAADFKADSTAEFTADSTVSTANFMGRG